MRLWRSAAKRRAPERASVGSLRGLAPFHVLLQRQRLLPEVLPEVVGIELFEHFFDVWTFLIRVQAHQ